jgi:hypothetical protein
MSLFLEPAASKLEIGYSILLDRYISKYLAGTQKLVLVSHLNPFDFFLHCRKQVEVTEAKLGK